MTDAFGRILCAAMKGGGIWVLTLVSDDNVMQGISVFDGRWDGLIIANNIVGHFVDDDPRGGGFDLRPDSLSAAREGGADDRVPDSGVDRRRRVTPSRHPRECALAGHSEQP